MWPWGHLAVGYLVYSAYVRYEWNRVPTGGAVLALALGTQFPDLVDKPLAWHLGVLPNGRSFAHSVIVAAVLFAVLGLFLRRRRATTAWAAFCLGYALHLTSDAVHPLMTGRTDELVFLAWPLLPPVQYEAPGGIILHFQNMEVTPFFVFQTAVTVLGATVWYWDGRPGLAEVRGWLVRRVKASRS